MIGTVKAVKREPLIIDRLWEQSQRGKLAYVTQSEFDTYYSNTICGVGIWVSEPKQWKRPIGLFEMREILGKRWQPPQQLQQLTQEQMALIKGGKMTRQHQLWDFVRPRTEHPNSVWRVIDIKGDRVTAEARPNQLNPRQVRRVSATADFFISLEKEEEEKE